MRAWLRRFVRTALECLKRAGVLLVGCPGLCLVRQEACGLELGEAVRVDAYAFQFATVGDVVGQDVDGNRVGLVEHLALGGAYVAESAIDIVQGGVVVLVASGCVRIGDHDHSAR